MINTDDVLKPIKHRIRDLEQEARIRELYKRTTTAYEVDRAQGIRRELEADWNKLQTKVVQAIEKVKKETGLF